MDERVLRRSSGREQDGNEHERKYGTPARAIQCLILYDGSEYPFILGMLDECCPSIQTVSASSRWNPENLTVMAHYES
jgi:hypothetical protein